jgi:ribosomal protein S18
MKIAIVGAGFYGCHLAKKISSFGYKIDLYDRNTEILEEAIKNNQHRLHLGFHYPRCSSTIEQAKRSFDLFMLEYGYAIDDIKENFYVIHKDSYINFLDYVDIFRKHNIYFEEINKNSLKNFFIDQNSIEGIIKVNEKKINLSNLIFNLRKEIYCNKNINLILNTSIVDITENSTVITSNNKSNMYDFVINTTYSNPSMGLQHGSIATKTELCILLLAEILDKKFYEKAFTVMDGDFISLYPADYSNTFTLSSVSKTPFYKNISLEEAEMAKKANIKYISEKASENIIDDFKKILKINKKDIRIIKSYISTKTKILYDDDAFRTSYYKRHMNNISLMCGKISAALDLEKDILREININD